MIRFFLFTLLLPVISYSQSPMMSIDLHDYDRLIIVDSYNNNYQRFLGVIYEIDLSTSPFVMYQQSKYYDSGTHNPRIDSISRHYDSIEFKFTEPFIPDEEKIRIGNIQDSLVNVLVDKINNPEGPKSIEKVFDLYEIDSLWLLKKKDSLLNICFSKQSKIEKREAFYIDYVLSNYFQFKKIAISKIFQRVTSHYPEVFLSFESEIDSIVMYNEGQYSFLLPWKIDTTYMNFNPEISLIVGQLLPKQDFKINKKYLIPTKDDFVDNILDQLTLKSYFISRKKIKDIKRKK